MSNRRHLFLGSAILAGIVGSLFYVIHETKAPKARYPAEGPSLTHNQSGKYRDRTRIATNGKPDQTRRGIRFEPGGEEDSDIGLLASRETASAVRELAALLAEQPRGDIRERLVALGSRMTCPEAASVAIELLEANDHSGVVRMAQAIFVRHAEAEAVQEILEVYDASQDEEFRDRLERTVSCVQSESAIPVLRQVVMPWETPATDGMLLASVEALSQMGTFEAVEILFERLEFETQDEERYLIIDPISEVVNPASEPVFQAVAAGKWENMKSMHTRAVAANGLARFPSEETIKILEDLSKDTNGLLGYVANESLEEIQQEAED